MEKIIAVCIALKFTKVKTLLAYCLRRLVVKNALHNILGLCP